MSLIRLVLWGGYLVVFVRFCDVNWRLRPFADGSLPWDSLFWGISSIVRFWGIIIGRAGRLLSRDFCFVLLGLAMDEESAGLTGFGFDFGQIAEQG